MSGFDLLWQLFFDLTQLQVMLLVILAAGAAFVIRELLGNTMVAMTAFPFLALSGAAGNAVFRFYQIIYSPDLMINLLIGGVAGMIVATALCVFLYAVSARLTEFAHMPKPVERPNERQAVRRV